VRDIRLPALGEFAAVNRVILQSEAWAIHGPARPGRSMARGCASGPGITAGWRGAGCCRAHSSAPATTSRPIAGASR
jgi:hypothetical protein